MCKFLSLLLLPLFFLPCPALCCTFCDSAIQRRLTLRQEADQAKIVFFGRLANPRLVGENGQTDLHIDTLIRSDKALGDRKMITILRYVPTDAKNPVRCLAFCGVIDGRIDLTRGIPLRGNGCREYLVGAMAIAETDRNSQLLYCFKHLDSPDPDVAADAFLEFAKASDAEIGAVAGKLAPEKLRRLLTDPATPLERLNLFAFMLGACGTRGDADLMAGLLLKNTDRSTAAMGGLLGGLIELRPAEGWELLQKMLSDKQRSFSDRLTILNTVRFFHAVRQKESKQSILNALSSIVGDGDMADLAIEDLRMWRMWDLTTEILSQYGKPSHAAPIVRKAIVRYALTCDLKEAKAFVSNVRMKDTQLVRDLEESLEFERSAQSPDPRKK